MLLCVKRSLSYQYNSTSSKILKFKISICGKSPMSVQELIEQAFKLSANDRLTLVSAIIQSLQTSVQQEDWQYLVARPHLWRRQLYIKGRKLLASTVWQDAIANQMSPEQAAENWDLPLAAIYEVIRYCESHQELIKLESDEEAYRLEEKGVSLNASKVIEQHQTLKLNLEDSEAFVNALLNPPSPNEALKTEALRYKEVIENGISSIQKAAQ